MKIIRPISVTDATLTSSNVGETVSAYAGGTSYALGDTVSVASGTTLTIYQSLQAGNVGNTPASSPAWWEAVSTAYAAYSGATTYALGDRVHVIGADSHLVYESLQAGNLNHTPATSPTWWALVGATNRWAMFDTSNTSQTQRLDQVAVVVTPAELVNAVALTNLSATSVRVTSTDATDGVVYDRTVDLVWDSGITDWYGYFFEPIVRKTDVVFTDLPPYLGAQIGITVAADGETVGVGAAVLGNIRTLGVTESGAQIGVDDYSIKSQDDYGNYSITERAFAKRGRFDVVCPGQVADEIQRLLAQYRATPIVYVGSGRFASAVLFGFYKDFTLQIQSPTLALLSIEIEGLT